MLKVLTFQGQIPDFLNGVPTLKTGVPTYYSAIYFAEYCKKLKEIGWEVGGGRGSMFLAPIGSVIGHVARPKYQGRICGERFGSVKTKSGHLFFTAVIFNYNLVGKGVGSWTISGRNSLIIV